MMKFLNSEVNFSYLKESFKAAGPYNHIVVDNFLEEEIAQQLAEEFPPFDDDCWYEWNNPLEFKRACNNWNRFGTKTYQFFSYLCSQEFTDEISQLVGEKLVPDPGLNGGGWHTHKRGGKLNAHLDYSLHPSLKFERKLNIIIYISPAWLSEWGGGLGLWAHDDKENSCGELAQTIDCLFNRAIIFDTTQNSWHGLPEPLVCPEPQTRNSLAMYYGIKAGSDVNKRGKALFVPSKSQASDPEILNLIQRRSDTSLVSTTYNSNDENN